MFAWWTFLFLFKKPFCKKASPPVEQPLKCAFCLYSDDLNAFHNPATVCVCVCVCVCYCVCKYVFISIYWLFFVKEFLLRWYWIISYGLKFLRRVPKSSNNFFNSLPWIFHYWSFSLYCLFKVACVVQIKLFFMDWFYYNLIIIIK